MYRAELWSLILNSTILQNDSEIIDGESTPSDIVNLFCKRLNRPLSSDMASILTVFLSSSQPMPMSTASACLYTFCNRQLPLFLFSDDKHKTKCEKIVTDKLSTLINVLVLYHFPLLAVHLDGIAPEWAQLCAGPCTQGGSTEGGSGGCGGGGNIIPTSWIGSLFAGSVLQFPDNTLKLWDWCVCWGEKYAGVYLAVTLLGLNEDTLRGISTLQEVRCCVEAYMYVCFSASMLIANDVAPFQLQKWLRQTCRGGTPAFENCNRFTDSVLPSISLKKSHPSPAADSVALNGEATSGEQSGLDKSGNEKEEKEKFENEDEFGDDGDEEDEDEDDDFPLETNNLSKMNEIHIRSRRSAAGLAGVESNNDRSNELLSTAWEDAELVQQLSVSSQIDDDDADDDDDDDEDTKEGGATEVTPEQLELLFLSGWLHATVQVLRGTPRTFQTALSGIVEDVEELLEHRKSALRSMSSADSQEDPYDGSDLDKSTHGFDEEGRHRGDETATPSKDKDTSCSMDNYEEEYGSECSNSALSSPMTPSALPSAGLEKHDAQSLSTYGRNIFSKGLSMITHKVPSNADGFRGMSEASHCFLVYINHINI
jgi:hypothetical protein